MQTTIGSPKLRTVLAETIGGHGFIRGLYVGTTPALLANVSEVSVMMATFGTGQRIVAKLKGKTSVQDLRYDFPHVFICLDLPDDKFL